MRNAVLFVTASMVGCSLSTVGLGGHSSGGGGEGQASHASGNREAAWKRFTVKDISLGAAIDKLPGYTCDADVGKYLHTCVKFLDDRCTGRPTYVVSVSFTSDLPKGQGCTYDAHTGATYLDRKITEAPMSAVAAIGTDTAVPRAYELRFTAAKDVLTQSSNIGKALIAKYGKPDFINEPVQMHWNAPGLTDTFVHAECGMTQGPHGDYCVVQVHDGPFLDEERSTQKERQDKEAETSGPAAPQL